MHRLLLAVALLLLSGGCATVVNGRYQTIEVDSYPSGAAVEVSCGRSTISRTVTPATLRAERAAQECSLTFTRDGYRPRVIYLEHQKSRATAMNAVFAVPSAVFFGILGAVLGGAVDGAETGAGIGVQVGADIGKGTADAVDSAGGGLKWVPDKVYAILVKEGEAGDSRDEVP